LRIFKGRTEVIPVVSNTVTETKLLQVSVRAFDENFTLGVPGVKEGTC
jgi:hypothetical protein